MLLKDFNTVLNTAVVLQEKLSILTTKGFQQAFVLNKELNTILNKESVTDNIENLYRFVYKNQTEVFALYGEYIRSRYEDT